MRLLVIPSLVPEAALPMVLPRTAKPASQRYSFNDDVDFVPKGILSIRLPPNDESDAQQEQGIENEDRE